MTIWVDAQLSPSLALWIRDVFKVSSVALRDLGMRDYGDFEIFQAARKENAVVLTKDADFPHLLAQHGPPPKIIWITCGNTSNKHLQILLKTALSQAINLLESGESIVEITDTQPN